MSAEIPSGSLSVLPGRLVVVITDKRLRRYHGQLMMSAGGLKSWAEEQKTFCVCRRFKTRLRLGLVGLWLELWLRLG